MADYTSAIEQIKQSDNKIYAMTIQIKEMEAEIKKTENESEIVRAKNKQLLQDIKYKKKILDDKNNELNIRQKEFDICSEMKKVKEKQIEDAQKALEEIQKSVFNSRIKFNEKAYEFINECDFLVARSHDIEVVVRKRKEENKLLTEINELEHENSALEAQYQELHKEFELLQDLERTKQSLEKEPEYGEEFKRIQLKIDSCEEKLEEFDSMYNTIQRPNLMKPCYGSLNSVHDRSQTGLYDKAITEKPTIDVVYQNIYSHQDINLEADGFVCCNQVLPLQENKKKVMKCFNPKIPSKLARKNSSKRQNIYKKENRN